MVINSQILTQMQPNKNTQQDRKMTFACVYADHLCICLFFSVFAWLLGMQCFLPLTSSCLWLCFASFCSLQWFGLSGPLYLSLCISFILFKTLYTYCSCLSGSADCVSLNSQARYVIHLPSELLLFFSSESLDSETLSAASLG